MSGTALCSPVSGARLAWDGSHALREPEGRRWPVVDGIAFLRIGRDPLVGEALACLDAGDRTGALVALLADQDDWWTGPVPAPSDLARLVEQADRLTLRDAMGLLAFGRVGDYFAHRWSDPTYLAGLALIEAHRGPMTTSFELACGIGHYGRELLRRGTAYAGADVVFAKLWLARHWVVGPAADLVCFDAASPWPVADRSFDLVLCQDAFYFLEPKAEILARMRSMALPGGWLAVGHVHNREAENYSAGRAVTAAEIGDFFPDGIVYDDAELTRALVEARRPVPLAWDAVRNVEAFAIAAGPGLRRAPQRVAAGYAVPPGDAALRPNPLYEKAAGDRSLILPRKGKVARSQAETDGDRRREAPLPALCELGDPTRRPSGAALPVPGSENPTPSPIVEMCAKAGHGGNKAPGRAEAYALRFPSDRYAAEYGRLATYPSHFVPPADPAAHADAVRRRALVDLPERW